MKIRPGRDLTILALTLALAACSGSSSKDKDGGGDGPGADLAADLAPPDAALPDTKVAPPDLPSKPDAKSNMIWKTLSAGTTVELHGVWGTAANDVYVVGAGGTVLRYDGAKLSPMASGTQTTLRGVWGSGASAVYAVGGDKQDGVVLRHDGSKWAALHQQKDAGLYSVWGSGASDVHAVGYGSSGGVALRYDGTAWNSSGSGASVADLVAVCGLSSTEVYAVGNGKVLSLGSSGWSEDTDFGLFVTLGGLSCAKADAYAVTTGKTSIGTTGKDGLVAFKEAGVWKSVTLNSIELGAAWARSKTALYALGDSKGSGTVVHSDGKKYTTLKQLKGKRLNAIWGAPSGELFVVGSGGTVLKYGKK